MSHDVFISYSSHDKATADAACARLESQGIRCWIAPRDVLPGRPWAASIVTAITNSRLLLLVFSDGANNSEQVQREVERAAAKRIPILPFRIENVAPTAAMEFFLCAPHWLDAYTPPLEKHLETLTNAVTRLLEATGSKAPTDEPVTRVTVRPPTAAAAGTVEPERRPALAPPSVKSQTGRRVLVLLAAAIVFVIISAAAVVALQRNGTSADPRQPLTEIAGFLNEQDLARARDATDKLVAARSPLVQTHEFKQLVAELEKAEREAINQSFAQRLAEFKANAGKLQTTSGQDLASLEQLRNQLKAFINEANPSVDAALVEQARGLERELDEAWGRTQSQLEFQKALTNLNPTGGPNELAAALSDVRNRYPEQSKGHAVDRVVNESQADLWNGVAEWSEYFSRREHRDAAMLEPATAGQLIAKGDELAQKYDIRMCVEEYDRLRRHLASVNRRLADLGRAKLSQVLLDRWTRKNQLLSEVFLVEVNMDGETKRYYTTQNPVQPGGNAGQRITINYIASYRGDTKRLQVPANSVRVRRAPHSDLVNSLVATISNAQNITTTDWAPTFCKALQTIQKANDDDTNFVDPLITVRLLRETLETASTGSQAIATAFADHQRELEKAGIDPIVEWFLPDNEQANAQRPAAETTLRNLPNLAAACQQAMQTDKTLYAAPRCRFAYAGWLKQNGMRWEIANPQISPLNGPLYVVAKSEGATAADLHEIASADAGQIRWKPVGKDLLLNWRPVFLRLP
jgi:hypothetical protein